MPDPASLAGGFDLPFQEQIEFFRRKLNLPTARWDDIWQAAHDRAFVVAGAAKADLLADLNLAVLLATDRGTTLETFRDSFRQIVFNRGWHGWTGEGTAAGEAWRTKVIYETNLRSSYAAGRAAQLADPGLQKLMPFRRYVHSESVLHPRPQHLAWNGLTLPHDNPFWQTHFPPNGWGCRCRVTAAAAPRKGEPTEPPAGWDDPDPETGRLPGIDRGWGYAPGANAKTPLVDLVGQKLIRLDAPIGAAMWEALRPVIGRERQLAWWDTLDRWLADDYSRGRTAIVGALEPRVLGWLQAWGAPLPKSAEIAVSDHLPKGAKQRRHEASQNGLTIEEWRALPSLLEKPGAIYFDKHSGKLVFVAEEIGPTKAVVEFDPKKIDGLNQLSTAFRVSDEAIAGAVKGGEWEIVEIAGRRAGVEPA